METARHRTIFLSDVHLGTRRCQAAAVLAFLEQNEADTIYLVGDIVDGWRLKGRWYWPDTHNAVVRALLDRAHGGVRILYIPGNHDEHFRDYCGTHFGGVEVMPEALHETADGRRVLVIHGDAFDSVVRFGKWMAPLSDWSFVLLFKLNSLFNGVRRLLGLPYWSLATELKHKVKKAAKYISSFEAAVTDEARRRKVDAVICGHIHHPDQRLIGEIEYINCGDWVESCTAVVEDADGRLDLIRWVEPGHRR